MAIVIGLVILGALIVAVAAYWEATEDRRTRSLYRSMYRFRGRSFRGKQ